MSKDLERESMEQVISNTAKIKQINVELVKEALIELKYGTKQSISNETGLSVATCGNILNELVESGEVIEVDLEQPSGGRPARRFIYNANFRYVAGIYVSDKEGINKITYAVTNLVGEMIEENSIILDDISYESIVSLIGKLIERYEIIKAIGIGVPAVVYEGAIVGNCDIKELSNLPLQKQLEELFPIEIIVENDMNLQALGFYRKQNFHTNKSIAIINFPKDNCIGSGIIVDGHIIKGNTNFAGEVSYLPLGLSQEDLIKELEKGDQFLQLAVKIITSIITVINPATIVLTGELVKSDMMGDLISACLKIVPEKHMPEITVRENIHDDYINGLVSVTIESLACDVQLVKKRI